MTRTKLGLPSLLALALVAIAAVPARGARQGRIAGHVTDASGRPLGGICATAVTRGDVAFPANTDATGNYVISVPAGTYKVYFMGCKQSRNYTLQWYPNEPSKRTARALRIAAGQRVRGIDARMQVGGEITGRVLTSSGRAPGPAFMVFADARGPNEASPMTLASTESAPDGAYMIVGLASGSYLVEFPPGGTGPAAGHAWYPQQPDPGHAQWVKVTAGQTTSIGLEILELPGAITGRVRDRSCHLVSGATVTAQIREPDGSVYLGNSTSVARDGSYRLGGLARGKWTVSVKVNRPHPLNARHGALVSPGATTRLDFTLTASRR
jgi:hypothetical protein